MRRSSEAPRCGHQHLLRKNSVLSYAKVRALTRVATPETEERLLAIGRAGTAEHVERIVRGWRRMDRKAERNEAARQHTGRALHVYPDEDGAVTIRGRLSPEAGALLLKALTAAREAVYQRECADNAGAQPEDVSAETPTMAQQQADALQLLAETALHHGIDPGTPAEHYQVVVHVDAVVLEDPDQTGQSVVEDGARVSGETSQRQGCDASRVVMEHDDDGRIIDIGAKTRTIPPALRRALLPRDRSCRFPGCHGRFCQAHHIRHWAQGGPTTLSNLVLLCRRHHRAVHEEGYQVDRQPDGELRFRRPDGRVLPNVPCPPKAPTDPVGTVKTQNDEAGIVVGPRTATPTWQGERLDVGYAIDVLHPRANEKRTAA
jgi:5-methylcytosine-specific restriction endonuclease McrA